MGKWVILLLLLISCGQNKSGSNNIVQALKVNDTYFNKYKESFILYLEEHATIEQVNTVREKILNITIYWNKESKYASGPAVASCINKSFIEIHGRDDFYSFTWNQDEELIVWHELAHCTLGLEHVDYPYDLMSVYLKLVKIDLSPDFVYRWIEEQGL